MWTCDTAQTCKLKRQTCFSYFHSLCFAFSVRLSIFLAFYLLLPFSLASGTLMSYQHHGSVGESSSPIIVKLHKKHQQPCLALGYLTPEFCTFEVMRLIQRSCAAPKRLDTHPFWTLLAACFTLQSQSEGGN